MNRVLHSGREQGFRALASGARVQLLSVVCLLLLAGCASDATLMGDRHSRLAWHPRFHTAQPGDTLYSIAWSYGQDYRLVARWNGIPPPYVIRPGQRIRVAPPPGQDGADSTGRTVTATPVPATPAEERSGSAPVRARPAVRSLPPTAAPLPAPGEQQAAVKESDSAKIDWIWPTRGTPVTSGNKRPGIDIPGRRGQPVYAAAAGRVVYSGSGLLGYGKLVILKHNEQFLSAYAHNWELLVEEGEQVAKGVQIARMGSSGIGQVMLHFEIRHNGRPVDPLTYLPKR